MRSSNLNLALSLVVFACACGDDTTFTPPATPHFGESTTDELLAAMTLEEKVDQMHGASFAPVNDLYETPKNERLGIPGLRMVDGPRGVRAGHATAFPVAAARAATWDPELERRVGAAIGEEASAKGATVLLAPTINVLRHPAWGRAQETYGEDSTLIGDMGTAFVMGAEEHVLACAKHFAANSIEDTRFDVNVTIDERALREVYLPHFRQLVTEGGVSVVMSAYNKVNGQYASENEHLLSDILKGDWAFEGFVVSDWVFGTHSTAPAANAGLDIEMPSGTYFGPLLVEAVHNGSVDEAVIDDAVRRILDKQLAASLKPISDASVVESDEHRSLARDVAVEGMVLLKNEGVLPLAKPTGQSTVAIVGALASIANLGDTGSSAVTPTSAVAPLDGLEALVGAEHTVFLPGPSLSAADLTSLQGVDAAVVVVGLTSDDEGEGVATKGGDRETLRLSSEDEALILSVAANAPRTVVVLEAGSAIVVRPWVDQVGAVLMAWYPGLEGGNALASVLFGDAAPGGRLPVSFPADEADLPVFDHSSLEVQYGFLHGYRYLDAMGRNPEFAFGFGLSYTTFEMTNLVLDSTSKASGDVLTVSVDVENTGARAGDAVVQIYVHPESSEVERAPRDLRGFARVPLAIGEKRTVDVPLSVDAWAYFDVATNQFVLEPGDYVVEAGSSSRELPLNATVTISP
ncbi:MAG: glycoside hydrolase family 3 C-terminal domain-containing protein [Polyangiaceae bacterium]